MDQVKVTHTGPFRMKAGQYVVFDKKDEHRRDTLWMGQKSTKEAGYNPNHMSVTKSAHEAQREHQFPRDTMNRYMDHCDWDTMPKTRWRGGSRYKSLNTESGEERSALC